MIDLKVLADKLEDALKKETTESIDLWFKGIDIGD